MPTPRLATIAFGSLCGVLLVGLLLPPIVAVLRSLFEHSGSHGVVVVAPKPDQRWLLHRVSSARPHVIAFPRRFERAAAVVSSLRFFSAPARRLPPVAVPAHASNCSVSRGARSLSATHAAAWRQIIDSRRAWAIFEDDIAVGGDAASAANRLRALANESACDLLLLGHCGASGRRWRCTHAYVATPRAATALLHVYGQRRGCVQPDDPQEAVCTRLGDRYDENWLRECCHGGAGKPGADLFGGGVVGQNGSLPHYLHFRSCKEVPRSEWVAARCTSTYDYETAGDGTQLLARTYTRQQ